MPKRGRGGKTPTFKLLLWAISALLLGLGLGALLSQGACDRKPQKAKPSMTQPVPPQGSRPSREPGSESGPRSPKTPQGTSPQKNVPRLSLVIDDFGYAAPELVTRLCSLPIPFSAAVLPYQEHTRESAEIAHRLGKEVMLHLPMEPIGYPGPSRDPGPNAVLYSLSEAEVRERVRKALMEIPYVKGVNNHMGSRITPDRVRMTWILQELKARKLFFVDSRTEKDSVAFEVAKELGVPTVQRQVFLDDDRTFSEMEKQWNRALKLAEKEGHVLVIGHIYPETVEALEKLVARSRWQLEFVKAGEWAR